MRTPLDDYLSPQHRTLMLIAKAAGILAYVALVVFGLLAAGSAYTAFKQAQLTQYGGMLIPYGTPALLTLNLAIAFISRLLNAVILWVLLSGLSLGLRMVVETDVNYRLDGAEVDDD